MAGSPDFGDAMAALGARHGLDQDQLDRLGALLTLLEHDEHAPTAVRDPSRALDVHLADSLVALELERVRSARIVADLGAGAGFPGLPLAIALRHADFRLVESQQRKCAFIAALIDSAGVANARVEASRAEQWPAGAGRHDIVLARALAAQPVVLEYAAPLLALGGALVDWRGARRGDEESAASRAAAELGMGLDEVRPVEPYGGARDLHLHVFVKFDETPAGFPRRAGMASKRPLGR